MQFQSEEETNAAPRESKLESSASQSTNMLTALRSPNRSATSPPDASQESQLPNPHRSRHLSKSSSNVQGQQHQQDPTIAWWAPAASAGGLAAPALPTVVCAMDNGSTKLRIPVKFVHRTHAVNLLMAAADAGSPLPVRGPSSAAATAPSDTLENSVSVNVLPQPIPTTNHEDSLLPASQGLVLGSAVRLRSSTRSADDGEGGNNVSNNVNEGSWHRSPSSGPQRGPQSFRQTDGREEDFSWSSADPAASAVAAAAAGTSQLQSLIHILREGLSLPTPPAICRLFQESKCRQGPRCHQIHVTRSTLDTFRNDARSRGNCCWEHDAANPGGRESEDPTWRWKLAIIHDALPRLKTISILINSGTSVGGGGGASGEGGTAVTPPTALSLPTLGPNQTSQGGPSVHYDPARAMERSGPNLVTSTGPESSLELSLTSTPFLSQHGAAPLSSPKYMYASGASYSGEFVGSGDDRSQRASLGEPLGIFSTEKVQIVTTRSQLHANQISPTLGLLSAVLEVLDACAKNPAHQIPGGLELPFSSLCRLHLRGPVCKFGDLCRYIHICRHSHISMAAIRSPATSGPERPLPSDGQLTTTSDRIHRTPQGSGHLISSVVATIGASSGSRTTVTTSSGGTAETNRTKNRSSSSDEEQQLSHVLLPCPTPPPPNVQVKIWQNMPYHFRRKKPSKSGGQPSQKTSSERPEKK